MAVNAASATSGGTVSRGCHGWGVSRNGVRPFGEYMAIPSAHRTASRMGSGMMVAHSSNRAWLSADLMVLRAELLGGGMWKQNRMAL